MLPLVIMKAFTMEIVTFTRNITVCVNHTLGQDIPKVRQNEILSHPEVG